MGKQFIAKEFKQYATNMEIIVKNIPIESHYSIRLVKYYYSPFYQIYIFITSKLLRIKLKLALQMFFKVFNNLARPNSLVPTLLIFNSYLCMTDIDLPLLTINQRSIAICKAMEEVKRFYASC